jgi:hypothetical protein
VKTSVRAIFTLLTGLCLLGPATSQAQIVRGSTATAARADTTSNYVDWWAVYAGPATLISCFGYNSGAQQWLQFYDSANGPTVAVTSWDASSDKFTATNHGLSIGQRIQLTGTVATIAAGIYYVGLDTNSLAGAVTNSVAFYVYDTLANAKAGGSTGRQNIVGATSTATLNLLPLHTFAIAATDNYSCIVPDTGMSFGKGIVIANSTTGPTYTAGSKNVTIMVTYKGGL